MTKSVAIRGAANTQMPAIFNDTMVGDEFNEFTAGVQSGFAVISFRGKVWRIRKGGKEESYLDDEGGAMPSIEVVMLRSNPKPSKIFYAGSYEEGSSDAPDCWSSNGVSPDAEVPEPVKATCAACPNNVWGSKMTPSGAKSRACADVRRVAVVFATELADKGTDATPLLLRIPPATLNPLKDYADSLQSRGVMVPAMVTKIGFDPTTSHAKLTFRPVRILTDDEAEVVVALRADDTVNRILAESVEHAAAGTADDNEANAGHAAASSPPAAASTSAARKMRSVDEEDGGEGEAEEAAAEVIPQPLPPPVKRKVVAPAPVAPPPVAAALKKPTPLAASDKQDYQSVLDAVLGKKKA